MAPWRDSMTVQHRVPLLFVVAISPWVSGITSLEVLSFCKFVNLRLLTLGRLNDVYYSVFAQRSNGVTDSSFSIFCTEFKMFRFERLQHIRSSEMLRQRKPS